MTKKWELETQELKIGLLIENLAQVPYVVPNFCFARTYNGFPFQGS
ncbi:MAG: hypothetical protein AAF573_03750 [Bacteroidota bacterium]